MMNLDLKPGVENKLMMISLQFGLILNLVSIILTAEVMGQMHFGQDFGLIMKMTLGFLVKDIIDKSNS